MENVKEYENILENKGFSDREKELLLKGFIKWSDTCPLPVKCADSKRMKEIESVIKDCINTSLLNKDLPGID